MLRSTRFLLPLLFVGLIGQVAVSSERRPSEAPPEKLNIVMFYIDDLGWTDGGVFGSDYFETPNIDRLAAGGLRFTDAYSCGPNCAPSRACMMSGQYSPRHGIFTVGDPKRGNHAFRKLEPIANKTVLDPKFVTVAETLQASGYKTAAMGKWHLGADPTTQGFDVNIAGREWGSPSGGGYHSPYKYPNLEQKQRGEYLTDRLTDEACQFIEKNASEPFFLYLTHYAVHTPIQAKIELKDKFEAKRPGKHHRNAAYAAMIQSVDESVGRVLEKLEALSIRYRTVVIYYSDNGGHVGATSNQPLRGYKGMLYEGGVRVPLLVDWPKVTRPNQVCDEPVIGVDIYPTLLELTGSKAPANYPLDGRSIVPLLKDPKQTLGRDAIYWHFPAYLQGRGDPHGGPFRTTPAGAIRMGDWKLIEWFESGRVELYNLADDLGESKNLADSEPSTRDRLMAEMKRWRADVNAPIPTKMNPRYDPEAKPKKKRRKKKN